MRAIDNARREKERLSRRYDVPVSSIVWMGNSKYIMVKNGEQFILKGGQRNGCIQFPESSLR